MEIEIRRATKEDAALIAGLSHHTFYETFAEHNTKEDMAKFMQEQFTHAALMAEVGAPDSLFLLAYAGDEAVGYMRLREQADDSLELARLYALKKMIGTGIGKALMQLCIDIAKESGKRRIWLYVWERNERAIKFYTAWGFEKVGTHDFRLGNDLQRNWIMQKNLV